MARTEAIMKGWRPRTEHRNVALGRHSGSDAGTALAEIVPMGRTTSGNDTRTLPDRPLVAAVPLRPGLVLDELLLNLLPLVEAGVLEVTVDPAMDAERMKTATLVFDECAGRRQDPGRTRRLSLRLTGGLPGNEKPGDPRSV